MQHSNMCVSDIKLSAIISLRRFANQPTKHKVWELLNATLVLWLRLEKVTKYFLLPYKLL
jgi:hypothetical protein